MRIRYQCNNQKISVIYQRHQGKLTMDTREPWCRIHAGAITYSLTNQSDRRKLERIAAIISNALAAPQ